MDRHKNQLGAHTGWRLHHRPLQTPGLEGAGGVHAPVQQQVGRLSDEPEVASRNRERCRLAKRYQDRRPAKGYAELRSPESRSSPGSQRRVGRRRGATARGGRAGGEGPVAELAASGACCTGGSTAAEESRRARLGIRVASVLPRLSPATDVGRPAVAAYARRAGRTEEEFLAQMGPPLTPSLVGAAVVRLLSDRSLDAHAAFTVDADGVQPLE